MHMRIIPKLGTFAPQIMRMRMTQENPTRCACALTGTIEKITFEVFFWFIN